MTELHALRHRLENPFHRGLLRRTYDSIRNRLAMDGYFPESLTGVYAGMFPRTTGALARLLMEVGEWDAAESAIHYCIQAMLDNGMERIAHVVGPRRPNGRIPILDGDDEVDGQAHVLLAWAMLACARGRCAYEDLSYSTVASLMDRTVSQPYLYEDRCRRARPGLVRNINFEHHREGEFWDCYDFLTQCFVCAALENLIPVAARQDDPTREAYWRDRLALITESVHLNMVRDLDGVAVYYEMLLPTGRAPVPYPGLSWVNLAPIPSGWSGVDPVLFTNTVNALRYLARLEWDGPPVTGCDWLPDGEYDQQSGKRRSDMVIGKSFGWEMVYCLRAGMRSELGVMLDFLEQVNSHDMFAEAFVYDRDSQRWHLNDPGNGEQACWWTWSMAVIRKEAGLIPIPAS